MPPAEGSIQPLCSSSAGLSRKHICFLGSRVEASGSEVCGPICGLSLVTPVSIRLLPCNCLTTKNAFSMWSVVVVVAVAAAAAAVAVAVAVAVPVPVPVPVPVAGTGRGAVGVVVVVFVVVSRIRVRGSRRRRRKQQEREREEQEHEEQQEVSSAVQHRSLTQQSSTIPTLSHQSNSDNPSNQNDSEENLNIRILNHSRIVLVSLSGLESDPW